MKKEYSAIVVRVGEIKPIEGSDFLGQTFIGDASLVVRKDDVKEGDVMFYVPNECRICEKFLSVNNLFEKSSFELNANKEDVQTILNEIKNTEDITKAEELTNKVKSMCGFFTSNSRVRMINLRKTPSMGFIFSKKLMVTYCPKISDINLEEIIGQEFDTVDGELFVQAYVPPMKEYPQQLSKADKRRNKVNRFDRMIDGEFVLHYDTDQLGRNMYKIRPDDVVTITNKLHGTAGVFANVLVKKPIKLPIHKKLFNVVIGALHLCEEKKYPESYTDYGNVYSSRTVIKNKYINKDVKDGYYGQDVWGEANKILEPFIEKGMTIYAEICGYAGGRIIQKGYDYGCKPNEFFIMPYRITTKVDGERPKEWEVNDVYEWTKSLIEKNPKLEGLVRPIQIFYHGTLSQLYPDVQTTNHWNENILQKLMNDKEHFGMEELEPICKNKVPREGIVIRKDNDPLKQAFKLKCKRFLAQEGKNIDNGEVDVEMQEVYN